MGNIIELRPSRDATVDLLQEAANRVRDGVNRELLARNINRPDLADRFADEVRARVEKWIAEARLVFEAQEDLSEQTLRSLEDGVAKLKGEAAARIAGAFVAAATSGVVAAFDGG